VKGSRLLYVVVAAAMLLTSLAAPRAVAASAAPLAGQTATCPTDYPTDTIQIMAPAAPGGGWDTTAREMQTVLQQEVIDQNVEVYDVPGAGGTIGIAQLVSDNAGDPNTLMMMGLVMVGAIATNQSAVTLDDVTPIARLTTEYEVIVVPADSEIQTLDDLITAFQDDPAGTTWAGGSAGGTDHILVGLIAEAVGVDPTQINYIPYSGGGEALAAILSGDVTAGVSGYGEFQGQIESGELRALAISAGSTADAATPGATASPAASPAAALPPVPTLQEQGVDVELANWRGVVAGPDIPDDVRQCMIQMVDEMHQTEAWQEVLARYGWSDYFLAGDEFGEFLEAERERVIPLLETLGVI
jgi:putative tricarboxylic transport membrane protein